MATDPNIQRFRDGLRNPKLVRTDDPLETDASFRDRLRPVAIIGAVEVANAYELDAIGWVHGMLRRGYRIDGEEIIQ